MKVKTLKNKEFPMIQKQWKTYNYFRSLAPVTFLFELLCLNLTYNQSVWIDFFVFRTPVISLGIHRNHPKERMVLIMIKFTTQELEMEKSLKQRIEFICEFCHVTPTITKI